MTYNELKKREVINTADGKSFGYVTDLELDFPKGILTGITVQGKKVCAVFSLFNRNKFFIPQSDILKIGGDVILVNVKCGGTCSPNVNLGNSSNRSEKKNCPPPCVNPCQPPCAPPRGMPSVQDFIDTDYEDM